MARQTQPPIYLTVSEVIQINEDITLTRGLLRDANLLASALARPQNAAYYEGAGLPEQAALLIEGIALNHAFSDGNKRTAMIAGKTFLNLNGLDIQVRKGELGYQIEQLVISHNFLSFLTWLQQHLVTL